MLKRAPVLVDQAAGLRRRRSSQPLRFIHCLFDSADSTRCLVQALQWQGWTSLLVDTHGRILADSPARSLFDWRQQLERGQLHTQPMTCGEGWFAPGIQGKEPALMTLAQRYDSLVFDTNPMSPDWALMPGAAHTLIMEVNAEHASMLHGYALLKTLSRSGEAFRIGLLGDAAACDHLQMACQQFLDPVFSTGIYNVAHEDDAFAALAVRMANEETSP